MGYHAGLSGSRRTMAVIFLTFAFSGALTLIADLDRPREGFLIVSQQAHGGTAGQHAAGRRRCALIPRFAAVARGELS